MRNDKGDLYTYTDAGFDGFFNRSIAGNGSMPMTLRDSARGSSYQQINFDQQQVSGALGDTLAIGFIQLDGKTGRVKVVNSTGDELVRLGEVSDLS